MQTVETRTVEIDAGMRRLSLVDPPVVVAVVVLGALMILALIRSGFAGVFTR